MVKVVKRGSKLMDSGEQFAILKKGGQGKPY